MNEQEKKQVVEKARLITRELADRGQLVEGGWLAFSLINQLDKAPQVQRTEMRYAWFASAQHVFAGILEMLEPGDEASETELRRMDALHEELGKWREGLKTRKDNE